MDLFETLCTFCGHNENMHVKFDGDKIIVDRTTANISHFGLLFAIKGIEFV